VDIKPEMEVVFFMVCLSSCVAKAGSRRASNDDVSTDPACGSIPTCRDNPRIKSNRQTHRGIDFAGSQLVFPGRDGAPFSNQAFKARIKLACERARVPVISAHPLRHTAATLLLNKRGANLRDVQALLVFNE
jgi:hypothetical protein